MSDYQFHWYTGPRVYNGRINNMTEESYEYAKVLFKKKYPQTPKMTQGGMFGHGGGALASAGTHNGGGVLDISVIGLTRTQAMYLVTKLRQVGYAAWYRPYLAGVWPSHIHAVRIGDDSLSNGAARQVTSFKNQRNGLANNNRDTMHTWVGWTTWERYKATHTTKPKPKPAPVVPKEFFDMSSRAEVNTKPQRIGKKPTTLRINNNGDISMVVGTTPDWYFNTVLRFTGLTEPNTITLQPYSINYKSGKPSEVVWKGPKVNVQDGKQAVFDGTLGKPPAGWSRRLRCWITSSQDGVTVTRVDTHIRKK